VPRPYRGILLDLFSTLIGFDRDRLPELDVGGQRVRTTIADLGDLLARWVPGVTPQVFLEAIITVSDELARLRRDSLVELPSRERFRRALDAVGCADAARDEAAVHLSRAHMAAIAGATVFPPEHAALLAALRPRYRIGLVSNFDDTATAYDILVRHGILPWLDTVVVSEAVGLRKPHPALVRVGLHGLGLEPHEVLFVGDTFAEDVAAAHAAGVDAAWIDGRGEGPPTGRPPEYTLRRLTDLAPILAGEAD
jgi:putative hydrolase of the HAD superfamily